MNTKIRSAYGFAASSAVALALLAGCNKEEASKVGTPSQAGGAPANVAATPQTPASVQTNALNNVPVAQTTVPQQDLSPRVVGEPFANVKAEAPVIPPVPMPEDAVLVQPKVDLPNVAPGVAPLPSPVGLPGNGVDFVPQFAQPPVPPIENAQPTAPVVQGPQVDLQPQIDFAPKFVEPAPGAGLIPPPAPPLPQGMPFGPPGLGANVPVQPNAMNNIPDQNWNNVPEVLQVAPPVANNNGWLGQPQVVIVPQYIPYPVFIETYPSVIIIERPYCPPVYRPPIYRDARYSKWDLGPYNAGARNDNNWNGHWPYGHGTIVTGAPQVTGTPKPFVPTRPRGGVVVATPNAPWSTPGASAPVILPPKGGTGSVKPGPVVTTPVIPAQPNPVTPNVPVILPPKGGVTATRPTEPREAPPKGPKKDETATTLPVGPAVPKNPNIPTPPKGGIVITPPKGGVVLTQPAVTQPKVVLPVVPPTQPSQPKVVLPIAPPTQPKVEAPKIVDDTPPSRPRVTLPLVPPTQPKTEVPKFVEPVAPQTRPKLTLPKEPVQLDIPATSPKFAPPLVPPTQPKEAPKVIEVPRTKTERPPVNVPTAPVVPVSPKVVETPVIVPEAKPVIVAPKVVESVKEPPRVVTPPPSFPAVPVAPKVAEPIKESPKVVAPPSFPAVPVTPPSATTTPAAKGSDSDSDNSTRPATKSAPPRRGR